MEINAQSVKNLILAQGIDLVGIADAKRLLLANPPRPATMIMPSAKTVIVMAVAHSLGAVYAPDILVWTRNKIETSRLLDQVAEKIGRLLEREGFLSTPISADKPVAIYKAGQVYKGKKLPHTRFLAHLSLKHAAVSAGLGEIGRNNLLLTPQFGPHQRLGAIITEAPLKPDTPFTDKLCTNCKACEAACPVGALKDGKYYTDPCYAYWSKGFKQVSPEQWRDWPKYLRMLWKHNKTRDVFIEMSQSFMTDLDHCIACMRACPIGSAWKKIRPKL
ncbi:MAG: 4Fe-4S binding protein [Candidatus Helarchaeota archaeon]